MAMKRLDQWLLYTIVSALVFLRTIDSSSNVPTTILESAVAKGAVCLDGTPPAYQFDKGFGDGVNNWLLHLQGGGACFSVEDCLQRITTKFGSSKLMERSNFTGILNNKPELNPNFYNWNRIFLGYCDGALLTGDVEQVDPATNLHFRGSRIFNVIVEELLAKGMKNAKNALLSGCSAGGSASILHCDKFRAFFPTTTRVKCISDAGYIPHLKDLSGKYHQDKKFNQMVALHGSAKNLHPSCTSKMRPSLCIYPQFVMPYIETPIFILNSGYDSFVIEIFASEEADPSGSFFKCKKDLRDCSASQLKILLDLKSEFLRALSLVAHYDNSSRGMFINTCYTHCQSESQPTWLGDPASELDNMAIANAVGDWFHDKSTVQKIDNEHVLPHYCAPEDWPSN